MRQCLSVFVSLFQAVRAQYLHLFILFFKFLEIYSLICMLIYLFIY